MGVFERGEKKNGREEEWRRGWEVREIVLGHFLQWQWLAIELVSIACMHSLYIHICSHTHTHTTYTHTHTTITYTDTHTHTHTTITYTDTHTHTHTYYTPAVAISGTPLSSWAQSLMCAFSSSVFCWTKTSSCWRFSASFIQELRANFCWGRSESGVAEAW